MRGAEQLRHRRRWAWHEGCRAELLVDGDSYFPAMLTAIDWARESVLMEFYWVASGRVMNRVVDALIRARERGVRVLLLMDDFGSRGLSRHDRDRLRSGGVMLGFYNPLRVTKGFRNFARDHRKLMVIDGRVAFIGGTALADPFFEGTASEPAWHELMLRVEGPVVGDWQQLFLQSWRWTTAERPRLAVNAVTAGDARMKVATTHGLTNQEIKANFRRHINGAEARVWLVTAYFLPSWSIRRALRNAARRGVDVRLLLPGPKIDHPSLFYAGRHYYRSLLAAGVRIFEFQPRFIHAKVGVCDGWVSLGSCNLDHWNLRWNLEANQEVIDPQLTDRLCEVLSEDMALSEEIRLESWLRRPLYRRFLEYCRGYVHSLLQRWI